MWHCRPVPGRHRVRSGVGRHALQAVSGRPVIASSRRRSPSGRSSFTAIRCICALSVQMPFLGFFTEFDSTTLPPVSSTDTTARSSQSPCMASTVTDRPSAASCVSRRSGSPGTSGARLTGSRDSFDGTAAARLSGGAVFGPYFPPDQREVLEFLAEGYSVEEVWRDLVSVNLPTTDPRPAVVDPSDYETAIQHTRTRIALVTASEDLLDILDKPFAAWRVFLHPSQHRVAHRASYAGPAQVTGGPGTGKTVVALHRVRHLLRHLRDGERILLTTYTNALVDALRSGLETLVESEEQRARVDITTVDAFARRVVATSRTPLTGTDEETRWEAAAAATGCAATPQFLAQEYRHVILAQDLRSLSAYEAAERRGRGSRLPTAERALVWHTMEGFTQQLVTDNRRTYLGTCVEASDKLRADGPPYRHIVIDEAQDLHPAQWRLLRAAAPERPDDLFIAGDPHQRIYDSRVSLKALGIKVTGRSTKLRKNYRSTHEILSWSTAILLGTPIRQLEDDNRHETLLGYRSALHGPGPQIHAAATEEAELDALVDVVAAWQAEGVALDEIGVTARMKKGVEAAAAHLKAAGIPAQRLRPGALAADGAVRVGTMHSFKGLEFRCVAVLGVDAQTLPHPKALTPLDVDRLQHETDLMAERCLLFVACTRARDRLAVSWAGTPSRFIEEAGLGG